jgi:hypothetical protein
MDTLSWAFVAASSALALFVEAARIVVALFISGQRLHQYFFVLLPLTVSTVSFLMTLNALVRWEALLATFPIDIHLSPVAYHEIIAKLSAFSSACQQQVVIMLVALALTIFLEYDLLPSGTALLTPGRARDRFLADHVSLSRRYL